MDVFNGLGPAKAVRSAAFRCGRWGLQRFCRLDRENVGDDGLTTSGGASDWLWGAKSFGRDSVGRFLGLLRGEKLLVRICWDDFGVEKDKKRR